MQAVITADIVNSTFISEDHFRELTDNIKAIYIKDKIEFYRGDSFQILLDKAETVLDQAIKSRLLAISFKDYNDLDIRISIGIGDIKSKELSLSSNMDKVFVRSGRLFDDFRNTNRKLLVTCGNEEIDFTLEIIAEYLDSLLGNITSRQAKVVYYMLSGIQQKDVAKKLNLSGATISQHVKTSRFDEIENLLEKYKILINKLEYGK